MKYVILTAISTLFAIANVNAQSDAVLINLKIGQTDTIAISQIQMIQFENTVSVDEKSQKPRNLSVKGNNPNPFNEQTTIEFEIAKSGIVEIIIYDNSGKQIQSLKCENCRTGENTIQWNGRDGSGRQHPSGVYYYEVRFGNEIQSKKMILINRRVII